MINISEENHSNASLAIGTWEHNFIEFSNPNGLTISMIIKDSKNESEATSSMSGSISKTQTQ
jgi:hypothetical protein